MEEMKGLKGYKVFNPDWTCLGFQYEVGKTYKIDEAPVCCLRGFHFCTKLIDCFKYYDFDSDNKVAEVIALGELDTHDRGKKYSTNEIRIVREISWGEVRKLVNIRETNNGMGNCGSYNSGDFNIGDFNNGDKNIGDENSGCGNSGSRNDGIKNTGNHNIGEYNSGDYNRGSYNSGNRNSGNHNSGDWNESSFSNGCFNTTTTFVNIPMFNKPSNWTYLDWYTSDARAILEMMPTWNIQFTFSTYMTEEERDAHPEHHLTNGCLMKVNPNLTRQEWWDNLSTRRKHEVMSLPNFDAGIFEQITGIKVD